MTTRTLLLSLIALFLVPAAAFTQTPEKDRKISGKVPGMIPRSAPVAPKDRRQRALEFVKREFPQVDIEKATYREASLDSEDARLERMLMGQGVPLSDAQRINYRDRLIEEAAMTEHQVNRDVDDEKGSWLMIAGAALILGLGMGIWIKRMA